MQYCHYRNALLMAVACAVLILASTASASGRQLPTKAFYLLSPPSEYKAFQEVVIGFKDNGADTLIIRPVSDKGRVDKSMLAKAVFFAHQYGLKLFVILPTRGMNFLLAEHPEWEDLYYDLKSGTLQPSGKLDLFNPYVTVYLSDLFREITAYLVDGIILDDDFYYTDTDGMSRMALERYKQKYGQSFSFRAALGQVKGDRERNNNIEEYGEEFWNLAELKKNRLQLLLINILQSSRAMKKHVEFGIALPVSGLFLSEKEILAWYGQGFEFLKKNNMFYLLSDEPGSDIATIQENVKTGSQALSSVDLSRFSSGNDAGKLIFAVPIISATGDLLPVPEIESNSASAKKAGDVGMAFVVRSNTELPADFIKNIFNSSNQ